MTQASTTTAAAVSNATPLYGVDGVTLSVTIAVVAPGGGSPTGTVTFYDGTTSLGTASVANGAASLTLGKTALSVGGHTIKAVYSGNGNFVGSSGTRSLTVQSAQDRMSSLIAYIQSLVDAGVLNKGNGNSLIVKIENAAKSLAKGNATAAVNQMEAFRNEVSAFRSSRKLTAAQADYMDAAAIDIIASIRAGQ